MFQPHRKAASTLSALAVGAVLLVTAACGDDDDDSATTGDETSGQPIKVMTWQALDNPSYSAPEVRAAAEAAVKGINDGGGIDGRQLDLEFCNTNFDPNGEAACARRAVDEDVVAVVGSTSLFPNTLPLLERGGVPYIGTGVTVDELTSEVSFPISGGVPGWFQGTAALALQQGIQRPALVVSPISASQLGGRLMEQALRSAGVEPLRTVNPPLGAPDQSAAAAQAADGSDAVLISTAQADGIKVIQSLRQAGYPGVIATLAGVIEPGLPVLGEAANGLLLTSQVTPVTQTEDPEVARFIQEMDATNPDADKNERSLITWASYQLVRELVERMEGDITAGTVLDAMNSLSEPIDTGVTAPYRVQGQQSPLPDYPRLFNPTVVLAEVRNGQIERTGESEFVNPFTVLDQLAGG